MNKNTMVELVTELEKLSESKLKDSLIGKAKEGHFHDFRSPAVCGKMYFVECAAFCMDRMTESDVVLMDKMRKDIQNGEYDEPLTDEDREIIFKEVDEDNSVSDEDKAFFKQMMSKSKRN